MTGGGEAVAGAPAVRHAAPCRRDTATRIPQAGMRLVRVEGFEAACPLAEADRAAYCRRFTTLFADEASARRGGAGEVVRATNASGEQFAVKRLRADGSSQAQADADAPAADGHRVARAAFDAEYDAHRRLTGLRAFPRLYGRGLIDGEPVLIMEWVEGMTLEAAARALAIDDAGRLSPLTAARIGRDLFDALASLEYLADGLAHRDVSLRNVMVDTSRLSLADQVEEGSFELRLIDFGSAAALGWEDGAVTAQIGWARGAAPDFAAPEMLTEDVAALADQRHSPAVDVYAAASVVHALFEGHPPYDLSFLARSERGTFSAYRLKTEYAPAPLVGVHGNAPDIAAVLAREPEVAVAVGRAAAEAGGAVSPARVRLALCQVDDTVAPLVEACLAVDQRQRPTASAMRDGLAAFCENYAENVGRALRGEPLADCALGGDAARAARAAERRRRVARGVLRAVCAAAGAAALGTAALLVHGMEVSIALDGLSWQGTFPGWLGALLLALPALLGLGLRERDLVSTAGAVRGTVGTLVGAAMSAALLSAVSWPAPGVLPALYAALFMVTTAVTCGFAADRALAPSSAASAGGRAAASSRRPVLPWGADPSAPKRMATQRTSADAPDASSTALPGAAGALEVSYEIGEE